MASVDPIGTAPSDEFNDKETNMANKPWQVIAVPAVAFTAAVVSGGTSLASTTPTTTEPMASSTPHEQGDPQFAPAPPVFPEGADMAVLAGDPSADGGVFTVRLRFPDGYIIPPHWHPTDEHVTVISGAFMIGIGDTFDEAALMPALEAGDFITAPANINHFAMAAGETEVQVHAVGPFAMTYVDPGDDPQNG